MGRAIQLIVFTFLFSFKGLYAQDRSEYRKYPPKISLPPELKEFCMKPQKFILQGLFVSKYKIIEGKLNLKLSVDVFGRGEGYYFSIILGEIKNPQFIILDHTRVSENDIWYEIPINDLPNDLTDKLLNHGGRLVSIPISVALPTGNGCEFSTNILFNK